MIYFIHVIVGWEKSVSLPRKRAGVAGGGKKTTPFLNSLPIIISKYWIGQSVLTLPDWIEGTSDVMQSCSIFLVLRLIAEYKFTMRTWLQLQYLLNWFFFSQLVYINKVTVLKKFLQKPQWEILGGAKMEKTSRIYNEYKIP